MNYHFLFRPVLNSPCGRKFTFLIFFLLLTVTFFGASSAFAEEKRVSIGMGAEINNNSGNAFAVGPVIAVDFNMGDFWALGLTAKGSHDFLSAWVAEGGAFVRRYFPGGDAGQPENKLPSESHSGFFAQVDMGVHFIAEDNEFMFEGDSLLRFMGGLRLGYRFLLGDSRVFYLEPFARSGYPFFWGAGLSFGVRF